MAGPQMSCVEEIKDSLNLCEQPIVDVLTEEPIGDPSLSPAEAEGSIVRIRNAVKYVRSSPQREQRFKACVEKERITSFERLEDKDPLYPLELSDGCPPIRDWDDARYFADFLQKFYDATIRLSGSTYVTSNICMARKMLTKFDKYWGKVEKINMLLMITIVLDPRYKFRYVKFCFSEFYESTIVERFITKVKAELKRMYDEYQKFNVGSSSSSKTSTDITNEQPFVEGSGKTTSLQSKFRKHLEEVETDGGKSEVDKYLEELCEKETSNFDILIWWKVNSSKYVILSKVARDVLAIPVSTVASESAFSTGGRVID
ncbi:hypothetical protein RHSIM_Rhsim12G0168900 [Rhododendron simsii]|uniref:Zinc finger BED domain-containing protein RICESLEEPER 2-like n=1 Tax=Rhododendron simsii TaxID=118357 RepID=A0A834G9L1_RHOSS|nr:hypothetical protein RHSIM_Rhsim12G0168900 [Rhododendron simsii]